MKKYLTCTVLASIMCAISVFAGACSCSDVKVSEIFFEKGAIELTVGDALECTLESLGLQILPTNASDKRVVFTIEQDKDKNGNKFNKERLLAYAEKCHYIVSVMRELDGEVWLYNYDVTNNDLPDFIKAFEKNTLNGKIIEIEKYFPEDLA